MKRLIILFVICSFFKTYSQNNFGVFTGLNYVYTNEGIFEAVTSESSAALQIGALYQIKINDKISFRPKIVFSQQGDRKKTEQSTTFNLTQFDYKLSYLNFPLDFKFWNKIYLITGPQIGFLLNQEKMSTDFGDLNSDFDLGINIGGGVELNKFFLELGIYQGFTSIFEFEDQSNNKKSLKNSLLKFTIGYNL